VAVASAGPYASLHLAPARQPRQYTTTQPARQPRQNHTTLFFTGRMPFLPPNQQRQSTEGITAAAKNIKKVKGKGSPYSITERRVPQLIAVLGSQPADDVSHKPGGRLPLLSARPAVTPATLKRAAANFAAW